MRGRHIVYLTGSRADFGLLRSTLLRLHRTPGIRLSLVVTGQHLSAAFGTTVRHVEASGLPVAARVRCALRRDGGGMSVAIGQILVGLVPVFERLRPDLLLVLGDRGEMLAGALAAAHLNIPVAHLHGGERSGSVDESVRHAITKLSHLHLTATREAARRVRALGEDPRNIFVVGAPGLDDALAAGPLRNGALARYGLRAPAGHLLVVQHPVTQEAAEGPRQLKATLDACLAAGRPVVAWRPNSDAGSRGMAALLERYSARRGVRVVTDLPREDYLGLLRGAAALVGNSSSGIIEAASFGVPVVNVGTRQALRERNPNVLDAPHDRAAISRALRKALTDRAFARRVRRRRNRYGDGRTGERIVSVLKTVRLGRELLYKRHEF